MEIRLVERTFVQYDGKEAVKYTIERTNSWFEFKCQTKFSKFVPYKVLKPLIPYNGRMDYSYIERIFEGAVANDCSTDFRKEVWFDSIDEAVKYFNKLIDEVHKYRGCIIYPFENGYYTIIGEYQFLFGTYYTTYAAATIDDLHKKIDMVKFGDEKEQDIGKIKSTKVIKTAKIKL